MSNHITATDKLESIAESLVSAGNASNFDEAIAIAVQKNPELYKVSCAEKIRPASQVEIDEMTKDLEPSALKELKRIADAKYLKGEAKSEADAMVFAIQSNPQLFKQKHKGASVKASDFEGKAKALVTAGDAKDIDEAFSIVAASDPSAYSEYLRTLK